MGHACTHHEGSDPHEHPVIAVIAIIAIAPTPKSPTNNTVRLAPTVATTTQNAAVPA